MHAITEAKEPIHIPGDVDFLRFGEMGLVLRERSGRLGAGRWKVEEELTRPLFLIEGNMYSPFLTSTVLSPSWMVASSLATRGTKGTGEGGGQRSGRVEAYGGGRERLRYLP